MGFRFRKSIKIMPGVRVNVSKSGFSTSVGGRGATMNVSKRGVRTTVGIPGSGLSYSTLHGKPKSKSQKVKMPSPALNPADVPASDGPIIVVSAVLLGLGLIIVLAIAFS